jgi:uncharacterized RDD family membrane protein YckC
VFCPRCGAENEEDAGFCVKCGSQISAGNYGPRYSPGEPTTRAPGEPAAGYAGFWKRFAAWIIDSIVMDIVTTVIGFVFGLNVYARLGEAGAVYDRRWGLYSVVSIVIVWLYYAFMESSAQRATLGKMALGIVVTDMNGERISFGRATGRFFGKIVSGVILFIGFIMAGFTERKQALHDLMAETLVVNKPY